MQKIVSVSSLLAAAETGSYVHGWTVERDVKELRLTPPWNADRQYAFRLTKRLRRMYFDLSGACRLVSPTRLLEIQGFRPLPGHQVARYRVSAHLSTGYAHGGEITGYFLALEKCGEILYLDILIHYDSFCMGSWWSGQGYYDKVTTSRSSSNFDQKKITNFVISIGGIIGFRPGQAAQAAEFMEVSVTDFLHWLTRPVEERVSEIRSRDYSRLTRSDQGGMVES